MLPNALLLHAAFSLLYVSRSMLPFSNDDTPGTYWSPCCFSAVGVFEVTSSVFGTSGLKHTNFGFRCLAILSLCNLCLSIARGDDIEGGSGMLIVAYSSLVPSAFTFFDVGLSGVGESGGVRGNNDSSLDSCPVFTFCRSSLVDGCNLARLVCLSACCVLRRRLHRFWFAVLLFWMEVVTELRLRRRDGRDVRSTKV